jgi:hypothetical protein
MIDMHAKTQIQIIKTRKPYLCRWTQISLHTPLIFDSKERTFQVPINVGNFGRKLIDHDSGGPLLL